ncbi:hypothetical protein [Natrarchaeobaculum aegyptiacum]|uniref:Serine kinase n=1 Tax=Natrarchaeobaculum aegyptiacum TaxID=745377 RepID=A0A2Z2HS84_9EURY|nr:hypothetical protein [Natrarchaeobaculum aegyptiacum]ARS89962.1 hypothetical protein B1756_09625 [Natrarchaeobaculum aegyptiacum]
MFRYTAYGFTIRSAFELPELPTRDDVPSPDVVIDDGQLEPVPDSVPGEGTRRIQATPTQCRLTYDGIGTFLVEDGSRVTFDAEDDSITAGDVPRKVVRRLFENEMMGVLCHQRGALVLHASAVAVEGRAAVFLGPRGAGKSTTAAAFHAAGYTTLEDDVVGIQPGEDGPIVLPGVPQLRLKPDAIDALEIEGTTRPEDGTDSVKRYKQLEPRHEPVPLVACYLLTTGETLSLEPVDPQRRVIELISRTYTGGMLEETDATGTNLEHCSKVATTVPFRRLSRPQRHDELPTLVERVAADLREFAPVSSSV